MRHFKLFFLFAAVMINSSPARADPTFDAGVQCFNKGDYSQALGHFQKASRLEPSNVNAVYYCAVCFHKLREFSAAIKCYQLILQLAPASTAAGYAKTALDALTNQSAARAASKAAEIAPSTSSKTEAAAGSSEKNGNESHDKDNNQLQDSACFYFVKEPNGHMAVNPMVDGHPLQAWFDTGADAFFYRDQLMAAGVDCNRAKFAGYTHGWAGKAVPVSSMQAEIKLGTLVRKIAITMEDSSSGLSKNLIGQSILRGYQYEIDDKGGRVDLRKTIAATEQKFDSLYDIPCLPQNGRDIVVVEINGKGVSAFIDTGSAYTILDAQTAERLGIEATGAQQMSGVGGNLSVGTGNANIRLGPIVRDGFPVRIGGSGGCCIGQDFMQSWRCKIDRQHNLLRFFH